MNTRSGNTVPAPRDAAGQARRSRPYGALITVGLAAYGVVHLLIAWVAWQLASGHTDREASQRGALQQLAGERLGRGLLWAVAAGLFALAVWQTAEAILGYRDLHGWRRVARHLSSAARAVVYVALGTSAARTAAGSDGGTSGGARAEKTLTARVLAAPAGRVLVVAVGIAVVGVAVRFLYRAATAAFTEDLNRGVRPAAVVVGRIGYAAKGVAFSIVGVLFAWAALDYDPQKAGGLDTALRTIRDEPAGPVLLSVVAGGIACFGIYCFVWSRTARR